MPGDPGPGLRDRVRAAEHDEDTAEAEHAVDEVGRDDHVEHALEESGRLGHLSVTPKHGRTHLSLGSLESTVRALPRRGEE